MKCVVCENSKGKRPCPAKRAQICPRCCGEKRIVEINCPSDCPYMASGTRYQSAKRTMAVLRREDDVQRRRSLYSTKQRFAPALRRIEQIIVEYSFGLRGFTDQNVLDALELVRQTYLTEQKGVIYEHSSPNPLVQALVRELCRGLENLRKSDGETPGLRLGELLDCLTAVEADVGYHIGEGTVPDSFVRSAIQSLGVKPSKRSTSLIVP